MLNKEEIIKGTLPIIKNASKVYLKLLNLKPDQHLDVLRTELSSSYRTVNKIVYNLQRRYGYLYVVRELESKNGWRVIRVENLETQKEFSNFRTKLHTMQNQAANKNNNFSDADLAQMVDQKIILATRDSADLIPRGVTAARLTALQTANDDFKTMPSDEELEGDVGIAVQIKNQTRAQVENRIGNVRTMAQNIFGEESAEYRSFGFLGMVSLPDNELSRISKVVYKRAEKFQAELLPEGCTPAFLTAMDGEVQAFDQKLDDVNTAEKDRLEGTGKRIIAGNAVYTETEKICNTAKDVYRESNPIKFSEYLMYPSSSGNKELNREGELEGGALTVLGTLLSLKPTSQTKVFVQAIDTDLLFYGSQIPAGDQTGGSFSVTAGQTSEYTIEEFVTLLVLNETNLYISIKNSGTGTGQYKVRMTHVL